jgi:mono/diheme cytochrome c family protein
MRGEPRWHRSPSALLAAGALAVVIVAELVFSRGSGKPSDFTLFLGRFHPLVVHLPIGVLVLAGLAEAATFRSKFRERIDPALGLGLPVLVLVTVTAYVLGHFLGRSGGYAANALTLHRRLEFLATVGTCVSLALFARHAARDTPGSRTAYRAALGVTLAVLSVGAHFGGTVTHGDSYLTEYAPGPVKALLGLAEKRPAPAPPGSAATAKVTEPLVFADVVTPLFETYCVECHGPEKQKGKLRVDSIAALMDGGEEGPAVVAGSSAASELMRRMKLPLDDDDRMPPEGKPGPTPEELAVIAFWIDRGASQALRVRDTLAPANGRSVLEAALAKAPSLPGAAPSAAPPSEANPRSGSASSDPPPRDVPSGSPPPSNSESEPSTPPTAGTPSAEPAGAPPPSPEPSAAAAPDGRAVLAERCEKCHGASKTKGGLRVDSLEAMLTGGENGPALVPGDPERSELVRRVRLPLTAKGHMPPKKERQPSAAEVSALAAWVRGLSRTRGIAKKPHESATQSDVSSSAPSSPASAPEASAAATESAPNGEAAPREPAQAASPPSAAPDLETPPDAELLARVPAELTLYSAVQPLLAKRCGKCHLGEKPAARLRIEPHAALVEGGFSGPGIVPGKPGESFIVQRISLPASDDDRMPPPEEAPMTGDEIALVRFWVERGAGERLTLPSKDVPASPLRAAAEYLPKGGEPAPLRADAGCAACAVGRTGASERVLALVAVALGALVLRRAARGAHSG